MSRSVLARRRSAVTAAALSITFVLGSFAASAPAGATVTSAEYKLAKYINASRSRRDISTLRVSSAISDLARKHSRAMADRGEIYHTSNLGYTLRSYEWNVAGENVGRGPSLWDIHVAMMNSEGHRANILYRSFKKVGLGVVYAHGRYWVTEMFIG